MSEKDREEESKEENKDAFNNKGKIKKEEEELEKSRRGDRGEELTRRESDRRRNREGVDQREYEDEEYEEEQREKKIHGLRKRRRVFLDQMDKAEKSDDPLNEVDWSNKDLSSKDRRKLRKAIDDRDLDDVSTGDIRKEERKGLKDRIGDNKKESRKETAKQIGKAASVAGTGGLTAVLAIPSMVMGSFRKRRLERDSKKTKRQLYTQRFLFVLPTILISLGFMLMAFFFVVEAAGIVSIALSHPEGIKELHKAGVLGDALHMGNVTEDVVILNEDTGEEEVLVKGNPEAQPGCFEWNGVWYCGGCLVTDGVDASGGRGAVASNNSNFTQGSGDSQGNMVSPLKVPFVLTSEWKMRTMSGVTKLHAGLDFVAQNELDVMAVDGGTVVKSVSEYAPNTGYEGSRDGGGWGNHVILEHEGQDYRRTVYAHFNSVDVKVGDKVSQGQKLGIMGHTGSSTNPHLHLEVWEGDTRDSYVDPRKYLKAPAEGVTWTVDGGG